MNSDLTKIFLNSGMIDSHFHLFHMKKREMEHIEIFEYCIKNGLEYAVDIGINHNNFEERILTAANYSQLYTAHGYYPSECENENLEYLLKYLEECLKKDKKAVALGEIGFDFFHNYGTKIKQAELFRKQLELANRLNLPVIIHSRDAEADTIDLLSELKPNTGGIIHCFSYSAEAALKFIDLGFYISFAGNLTYKKSEIIQDAAKAVPLNRLLLETDAPYLSPQQVRSKKNHPGYIGYTYDYAAKLKGIPLDELISSVNKNFKSVFNLPAE